MFEFIKKILQFIFGNRRLPKVKKVLLDAGHGGKDTGAKAHGAFEKNVNLDIVLSAGRLLESKRADTKIYYTRIEDRSVSLNDRYEAIMDINPNAFVSVHCNAIADDPSTLINEAEIVQGVEIFYRDEKDLPLANAINRLFIRSDIWKKNRGVKQDQEWLNKKLAVLNNLEVPGVLVEIGFLSNRNELMNILEHKMGIADLLTHGIIDFLDSEVSNG